MTMQPDTSDKTRAPMKPGPVKIEWNWDLDEQWCQMKSIKVGRSGVRVWRRRSSWVQRAVQPLLGRAHRQARRQAAT